MATSTHDSGNQKFWARKKQTQFYHLTTPHRRKLATENLWDSANFIPKTLACYQENSFPVGKVTGLPPSLMVFFSLILDKQHLISNQVLLLQDCWLKITTDKNKNLTFPIHMLFVCLLLYHLIRPSAWSTRKKRKMAAMKGLTTQSCCTEVLTLLLNVGHDIHHW